MMLSCSIPQASAAELVGIHVEDFFDNYRLLKVVGKGGKGYGLQLEKLAAHSLAFHIDEVHPHLKGSESGLLFCALKTGRPMEARTVEKIVGAYGEQLGSRCRLRVHTFRYNRAIVTSPPTMERTSHDSTTFAARRHLNHRQIHRPQLR